MFLEKKAFPLTLTSLINLEYLLTKSSPLRSVFAFTCTSELNVEDSETVNVFSNIAFPTTVSLLFNRVSPSVVKFPDTYTGL